MEEKDLVGVKWGLRLWVDFVDFGRMEVVEIVEEALIFQKQIRYMNFLEIFGMEILLYIRQKA